MRSNSSAFLLVLIVATLARVLRMHVRWDEITLAYAAYPEPLLQHLDSGRWDALIGGWIGLHPPLWGIVHAFSEALLPVPWVWMGISVLASLAAVAVVGRTSGWVAALVLATAPVHLLDSAEVNNYPLAGFFVAALFWTVRKPWPWLVAIAVLAGWTHLLAGLVAVAVVVWRAWDGPVDERLSLIGWTVLGLLPVAAGAARLMGQGSTWAQPDVSMLDWMALLANTVGLEGLLMAPLVLLGMRGAVRAGWLTLSFGLVLAVWLGAAAAHQRPYLGLVAPIAALAVAEAVRRYPKLLVAVVVLCCIRGVRFVGEDVRRMSLVMDDLAVERGIDVAIAGAGTGDTIWLVSPALQTDDDKTATGEAIWRFRPWETMTVARPVAFEYKDYRYGQPRHWRGFTIHSSTELDAAAFDHIASAALEKGQQLWVVLYDHSPATGLDKRLMRTLQPYNHTWQTVGNDRGLGADRVAVVEGLK